MNENERPGHVLDKVSVVIPCYNCRDTILECIGGLLEQDYPSYEVIVVDDNSRDGTEKILAAMQGIKLIKNKINFGPAYTRNAGVTNSSGEIIIFIDGDSKVLDRHFISRHAIAHCAESAQIIGGGIQGYGRSCVAKADKYSHWFLNIPYSANVAGTHLVTNNMSVKRKVFDDLGGFDTQLMTGEDTDFCERALKKGYKLKLISDAVVLHKDRERFTDFMRCFYLVGLDRVPTRRKKRHRYHFLLPPNLLCSLFYCLPLACLLTIQVIISWLRYDKKVIFYSPIIFMGRLAMSFGIVTYYFKNFKKDE